MESQKTRNPPYLLLIVIILIVGSGVFYIQNQLTKFTVELSYLEPEYYPFAEMISFDAGVKVSHTGTIQCVLEDMTLELTLNDIDCGGVASDSAFEKFSSNSIMYRATFGVPDSGDARVLNNARSYVAIVTLKARAKIGFFTTILERTASRTFYN